jgi:hypothetical protein
VSSSPHQWNTPCRLAPIIHLLSRVFPCFPILQPPFGLILRDPLRRTCGCDKDNEPSQGPSTVGAPSDKLSPRLKEALMHAIMVRIRSCLVLVIVPVTAISHSETSGDQTLGDPTPSRSNGLQLADVTLRRVLYSRDSFCSRGTVPNNPTNLALSV